MKNMKGGGIKASTQRLSNIEFIRSLCAIGIVCYHFAIHSNCRELILYRHKNGVYGDLFVTVFFILSGGMLYLNNPNIDSLKIFYYKRFKSIFPSFYIGYIVFFIQNVIKQRTFFYGLNQGIKSSSLILTIFGVDGYFSYANPNYYILGEWFLGAIIILYLLYPYLLKKINAQPLITSIVVLMLFLSVCYFNVFYIRDFNNLFSCLISFFVGMLIFKYNKILKSKLVFLLSLFSVTIMFIIKIPINENLAIHIMGLLFFIVLYWIGILLTKPRILKFIFEKIGKISYQIFLLQHIIIYRMLLIHNPEDKIGSYKYLSLVIFVTLLAATGLFLLTKFVLNTKTYIETENRYLKTDIIKDDTKEQIKNMDN